jgi:hypothetical protein
MEKAVQTAVVLLAMAIMVGATGLAIRYINTCWRRVERIQPLQELQEKERERAEFVRTHLPTRIWRSQDHGASSIHHHHNQHDEDATPTGGVVPSENGSHHHPGSSVVPSVSSMLHDSIRSDHQNSSDVVGMELPFGCSVASSSLSPSLSPVRGGEPKGSRRGGGRRHQLQMRRRDSFDSWSVEEPEPRLTTTAAAIGSDSSLLNLSLCSGDCSSSGASHTYDAGELGMTGRPRCAICSRSFRDGRDVVCDSNNRAFCSHVFHADCMTTWLIQNPRCPLCRHEYLLNFAAKWKAGEMPARPASAAEVSQSATASSTSLCPSPDIVGGVNATSVAAKSPSSSLVR